MTESTGTAMKPIEPKGTIQEVRITYDSKIHEVAKRISVEPETFYVSKGNCEQVRWFARYSHGAGVPEFSIDFNKDGSPFEHGQFNHRIPFSGLVRREVLPDQGKIYHYTIRIGSDSLDPGGGVKA